jgi:hypothetical protein
MSFRANFSITSGVVAVALAALLLASPGLATEEAAPVAEEAAAPAAEDAESAPATDTPVADETPAIKAPNASEHSASVASEEVALARFTTAVENREPVDAVAFLGSESTQILFYTDLRGLAGETVTHRWEYGGDVMAEVPFEVGSNRFRVWSSKRLKSEWKGEWTVFVVKGDGEVIATESFTYQE